MGEFSERPIVFQCRGETMLGILHGVPSKGSRQLGVLIVVGGPQYRVGSHRQFLLLARALARAGYPVFRFDLRGMGDSTGSQITFNESGPDIEAAISAFFSAEAQLDGIVLWGLCDAASSILIDGVRNPEVRGVVLLNPWVHSDASIAGARVEHYYGKRLLSRVFWKNLLGGKVAIGESLRGFLSDLRKNREYKSQVEAGSPDSRDAEGSARDFRERMLEGINGFNGPVLLILSGADLTAGEFVELTKVHDGWRVTLERPGVMVRHLDGADHTFSTARWRTIVESWTREWLASLEASGRKDVSPVSEKTSVLG